MKESQKIYRRYIKRILDFILSLFAIILLFPFLVIVALLIKLDSSGKIFYTQERPGKNQKIFKVYKFRTMKTGADRFQKVGVEVMKDDARITPLGKSLRRFKIDELAQLLNILKGDMSIVGPRPTLPEYLDQYEEWEKKRFELKPGLTGLAQVNGNIYLERTEKSRYDVEYVERVSLWLDIRIIFKTVAIVMFGEDKFVNKAGVEK
ncbi:MAG: sugar transferase [Lachnospiraceae bacterium]|nr:sugar transferase [Lachnospiraceae bacterium]MCM1237869.1 sugar transferase [Lachnospiraceae bacterium]